MPRKNLLLVLVVHEPGLRSMLVAQLSLLGGDVATADDVHDPVLERAMRGPAVLVVDQALVARNPPGWIDAQCGDARWHDILVLTAGSSEALSSGANSRPRFLDRTSAVAAIAELLARWICE